MPEIMRTAKILAHGKIRFSGSGRSSSLCSSAAGVTLLRSSTSTPAQHVRAPYAACRRCQARSEAPAEGEDEARP